MKPRGLRNNNPLNIRLNNTCWQGMSKEQTDGTFVQFTTLAYGYRAAWRILFTYFYRFVTEKKPFNVRNILHRWAPPTENDTEAYIRSIEKLTGIGEEEKLLSPIYLNGYHHLARLIAGMTVMENGIGMEEVDHEAIQEGYCLAFPDNREAVMLGNVRVSQNEKRLS